MMDLIPELEFASPPKKQKREVRIPTQMPCTPCVIRPSRVAEEAGVELDVFCTQMGAENVFLFDMKGVQMGQGGCVFREEAPHRALDGTPMRSVESLLRFEDSLHDATPCNTQRTNYMRRFVYKRDDALREAAQNPSLNYIMAKDAGPDGTKMFAVVPRTAVRDIITTQDPAERCFYAVLPPSTPVDVYLDLDKKIREGDPPVDKETMLYDVLKHLQQALQTMHNVGIDKLMVLDACTDVKVSYHVHCVLKGDVAFDNTGVLQSFLKAAFGGERWGFVDTAPYGKFACFRLPGCVKKGKRNCLRLLGVGDVGDGGLREMIFKHTPFVFSEGNLIDLCLITRTSVVRTITATFSAPASLRAIPPNTTHLRPPKRPSPISSTVLQCVLKIFRSLSPHYARLTLPDISVKQTPGVYKATQKATTWCSQANRKHSHATTYISICRTTTAISCWSSHCPKQIIRANETLACYSEELMNTLFGSNER